MLELKNVTKIYCSKSKIKVNALKDVSVNFPRKGLFFITGKSGCGKTTLLNILGGLDAPTSGEVYFDGEKIDLKNLHVADNYRRLSIGFVFQDYNLIDNETIMENVNIAAQLVGKTSEDVANAISRVGLSEHAKQYTDELSGGQKQRVAIARVLVKDSKVVLADEPTGNLDSSNAEDIFLLLKELSADRLIVVVTHDSESAEKYGDGIICISDGKITNNSICAVANNEMKSIEKINNNSYSVRKKTLFGLGVKNLGCKKGRSILTAVVLLLSITVLLWAQMLLSTTSEKVLGRELKTYNQQQILLYQGYNFDKYVLNDEASKESHPNISLSALKYIYENTNALPLINLDMEYVGIIDNKNAIKSLGFDLYDNSLEMTDPNYIYVSDYLFDETHNLKNGCLDYSAYIGKEVTVNWKKGILAGVFKTNYTSYVDWDYEHGQFTYKRNLNERDRYKIAFIDNIKNLFFCSQQYYDEHNLNGYIFNSEIKTSERKNGSTTYYGLSELTFSTDIGDVAITKEVRITDEADNGHFDDWGDYIEESFAPNENEIYISRKLYKKLFGVSYDANSADSHLGSTIDISLRENGSEKILSTIKGKVRR